MGNTMQSLTDKIMKGKENDLAEQENDYYKKNQIKFISAIDSKPVFPPYLKLLSLKQYRKMTHDEK